MSAHQQIFCPSCGTTNRLPKGRGLLRCGRCKAPILPDISPFTARTGRGLEAVLGMLRVVLLWSSIALSLFCITRIATHSVREAWEKRKRDQAAAREASEALFRSHPFYRAPIRPQLISAPPSGEMRKPTKLPIPFIVPLVIHPGDHNYVLKLVDPHDSRRAFTIFVQKGLTTRVEVPLGLFSLKYASGDQWYGYAHLFGPDTRYGRLKYPLLFEVEGYTDWRSRLTYAEDVAFQFMMRHGVPFDTVQQIRATGFDDWPYWEETEKALNSSPAVLEEYRALLKARQVTFQEQPTTIGKQTLHLDIPHPGQPERASLIAEEF